MITCTFPTYDRLRANLLSMSVLLALVTTSHFAIEIHRDNKKVPTQDRSFPKEENVIPSLFRAEEKFDVPLRSVRFSVDYLERVNGTSKALLRCSSSFFRNSGSDKLTKRATTVNITFNSRREQIETESRVCHLG
jgi:hypothetical protein